MTAKALCFRLPRCPVRSFARLDIVTTMSHEWLKKILIKVTGNNLAFSTDDLVRFWRSKVKGQGHSRHKYKVAKTSTLTQERGSP